MPENERPALIPLPVQAVFCLILLGVAMVLATALIIVAASQMNALEERSRIGHGGSFSVGKLGASTWDPPRPTPTVESLPVPVTR